MAGGRGSRNRSRPRARAAAAASLPRKQSPRARALPGHLRRGSASGDRLELSRFAPSGRSLVIGLLILLNAQFSTELLITLFAVLLLIDGVAGIYLGIKNR